MKKFRKPLALLLCALLALSLCACGSKSSSGSVTYGSETYGRYRTLASFGTQQFAIGFRKGDFVRTYVEAALKVLAADGTIHGIALTWFADDPTVFESDADALEKVGTLPVRELIVGLDPDAFPMSYADGDSYAGFDVDLARAVCDRLGWSVRFIPIKAETAYEELNSGDVDVAWGGLALDTSGKKFIALPSYMTNELVLVVRTDSGIRGVSGLKGRTLAMDVDQKYMDALSQDASLKDSLGQVTRVTGGAQKCFEALDGGQADAVIVYSVAARYYGK